MRGRQCTCCYHPERREIDEQLIRGVSVRQVADTFHLTKSAVGRHRADCLAPKLVAAARVVAPSPEPRREVERAKAIAAGEVLPNADDILLLTGLLERLARSLQRLEKAADKTVTDQQPMALAALSGQLHRGIETAAKLTGAVVESEQKVNQFAVQIVLQAEPQSNLPLRDVGVSSAGPADGDAQPQRRDVEVFDPGEPDEDDRPGRIVMTIPLRSRG